jgi:hypothetical protein
MTCPRSAPRPSHRRGPPPPPRFARHVCQVTAASAHSQFARCERVTAVAGAATRTPEPGEPDPDLSRGPRAVAGRCWPRVSPVTPARYARGRGNALFEHVFRSCGCHRAAAGLESSSKDCTACAPQCCRAGHWQPRTCVGYGALAL